MTLAIRNEQMAMHYQLAMSNDAAINRTLLIAYASHVANRNSLITATERSSR